MSGAVLRYSLPRWRLTRWLADAGPDVPPEIRVALIGSLYGTLPIFAGGVINSLAVSFLIAWRIPTLPFMLWCAFELLCCGIVSRASAKNISSSFFSKIRFETNKKKKNSSYAKK